MKQEVFSLLSIRLPFFLILVWGVFTLSCTSESKTGKKLVDTPETRRVVAAYYDNVMDTHFGEILELAAKQEFANNLVTIYTSDHGAGLPFAKWTLYDEGMRVPFIIRWPGMIETGRARFFVELVGTGLPEK